MSHSVKRRHGRIFAGGRHGSRGRREPDRSRAGGRARKALGVVDWGGTGLRTATHVQSFITGVRKRGEMCQIKNLPNTTQDRRPRSKLERRHPLQRIRMGGQKPIDTTVRFEEVGKRSVHNLSPLAFRLHGIRCERKSFNTLGKLRIRACTVTQEGRGSKLRSATVLSAPRRLALSIYQSNNSQKDSLKIRHFDGTCSATPSAVRVGGLVSLQLMPIL